MGQILQRAEMQQIVFQQTDDALFASARVPDAISRIIGVSVKKMTPSALAIIPRR